MGLLVVATATVIVSAETGIVTSRYDIPMLALLALVLARSACRVGRRTTLAVAVALAVVAVGQVSVARARVQDWARAEALQETLVREVAARRVAGCRLEATGSGIELVEALPVLEKLVDVPPHGCRPG